MEKQMSDEDYKIIASHLREQGLSEDDVMLRMDKLRLSYSDVGTGDYDPYSDTFQSQDKMETQEITLPRYEDVPPLTMNDISILDDLNQMKIHLPIDMYGELAQSVVMAMSQGYIVNPDVLAATALVAVAVAANRKTLVKFGNYDNRSSIWFCMVEPTGSNKSEPMKRMLRPIEAINESLIESSSKDYAAWKDGGEKGTPPPQRKIIISDSTPEVRNRLLKANGLLLYRDEINGFFKDLDRYNQSGEVETLISIWSNQDYSVDRVTSTSFYVSNPFLCICGGLQPEVIKAAFSGKNFEGSGFLWRWLFMWLIDSKVPDHVNEVLIDQVVENNWYNFIQDLWRMPPKEYHLSQGAAQAYQDYMKSTAQVMNDGADFSVRAMLAKMRIYALRFALIIHLLRHGKNASLEIDDYTMQAAIKTCDAFEKWNTMTIEALADKDTTRKISNADLLRELASRYNITNQSELARLIGKSQQYVSRILNAE